jgi:hypothetical protein
VEKHKRYEGDVVADDRIEPFEANFLVDKFAKCFNELDAPQERINQKDGCHHDGKPE